MTMEVEGVVFSVLAKGTRDFSQSVVIVALSQDQSY